MVAPKSYTEEIVKKGRRTYGSIRTYDDGRRVYLAWRKQFEIYRAGRASLSDAMREGKAGWAIDEETLLLVRSRCIPFLGVLVIDTGDKYLTTLEKFYARGADKRWFMQDHTSRGGSLQRVMPLGEFSFLAGEVTMKLGA